MENEITMTLNEATKDAVEPPLDCNVGQRIERYLRQLAPHQNEREGPTLMREALAAINGLARYAQHQQARIDALMLEYCPEEMTPEQVAEWERHQQAVPNLEVRGTCADSCASSPAP